MSDLELRTDAPSPPSRRVSTAAVALTLAVVGAAVPLVVLWALRAGPDGAIRLAVSLDQGDEFSYRMKMALDGTWDLGGQEMHMDLEAVTDMDYRVEDVEPDGVMVLDISVRLVEMSVGGLSVPDATATRAWEGPRRA